MSFNKINTITKEEVYINGVSHVFDVMEDCLNEVEKCVENSSFISDASTLTLPADTENNFAVERKYAKNSISLSDASNLTKSLNAVEDRSDFEQKSVENSISSSDTRKLTTSTNIVESIPKILCQTIDNVEKMPKIAKMSILRVEEIITKVAYSIERIELLIDFVKNSNVNITQVIEMANSAADNVRRVIGCFTDLTQSIERVIEDFDKTMTAVEKVLLLMVNEDPINNPSLDSNDLFTDGTKPDDSSYALKTKHNSNRDLTEHLYLNFALDNMEWTWENSLLCITGEFGKSLKHFSVFLREISKIPEKNL